MRNITLFIFVAILFVLSACQQNKIRYHIGVSQCSDDEWRQKMNKEIEREAVFYDGVNIDFLTSKDDNAKQSEDIEYFIDKGVDLLIVSPNEAEAIAPAVEKAVKKGIPVIMVDRKISSDNYTAYLGADNYEIGKTAGEYIITRLNGKGNIVEIKGLSGSTPAIERHKGLMDVLANAPDIRVIASVKGDWQQENATDKMDSLLKLYPEIDLVFAQNDRMASGAYNAAKKLGRASDIAFVGVDALPGNNYGLHQVQNGELDATFIYPTGGDKVLQTAMNVLTKQPYEKETFLPTALIAKTNARLMQLQADEINSQDQKLERLNSQIDEFWSRYSAQTSFLYVSIICLVLFACLLFIIIRAYWTKNRLNMELSSQKLQLEEQRDQLITLSKQLEEATQSKLVFFTNISHDFRTPLTLIADPVEQLLENDGLSPKQEGLLKVVHKNVNILLRLVNEILDFRKYENGKLELQLKNCDLKEAVGSWSQAFQSLALKKHIHFNVGIADGNYHLLIDENKIERIFFNLLSNAFKFTPENGDISVDLSILTKESEGILLMKVADNGKGMSAEQIQKIFDRFYQTDVNHAGSGIGLALVKALVDLQGGTIEVESQEGKGTLFSISIPVVFTDKKSLSDSSVKTLPTTKNIIEELSDTKYEEVLLEDNKECLLIIDDNADVRQYIKTQFQDEFCIIEADNGRRGIQLAMKYVPDLIVSDVMMPVMDGLECCKVLKSELQTSHIPVVLLTACSLDEQKVEGLESGADSYISKPFNSKVLTACIHNLIQNRKRLKHFFGDNNVVVKESVSEIDKSFADRFRKLIEEQMSDPNLSVEQLGSDMGLSRVQLYRKIKSLTNYSPVELLRIARLKRAASLLASTEKSVSEIAYEVGFTSPSYFSKCYKEYFGEDPTGSLKKKNG